MTHKVERDSQDYLDYRDCILDTLLEEDIYNYLHSLGEDEISQVQVYSSIASTNDVLLDNDLVENKVAVCVAEQQTKGRGRYGHQWQSPGGANLYLSMAWPLHSVKQRYELLCLWLLIALANFLVKYGCNGIQLKWPNDLCVANRKLAGILLERKLGSNHNHLIIGLGLNIAMSAKRNVKINTPWIDLVTVNSNWSMSRNQLVAEIIHTFHETLSKFESKTLGNLSARWKTYDILQNKKITFRFNDKVAKGVVVGVDELGQLIVNFDGNQQCLQSAHIREIRIAEC